MYCSGDGVPEYDAAVVIVLPNRLCSNAFLNRRSDVLIRTKANKVPVNKVVNKFLKEVKFSEGNDDKPKYELANVKVNLKGLENGLLAYKI